MILEFLVNNINFLVFVCLPPPHTPLRPFPVQSHLYQYPPYEQVIVFVVAPLALNLPVPPWNQTSCRLSKLIRVPVLWNNPPPPPPPLPTPILLLHQGPVAT